LRDYDTTAAQFSWDSMRAELEGLPGGAGLNIAHEAVDRHARGAHRETVALRWLGKDGTIRDITYGALQEETSRFAQVLRQLGVQRGERVFALAGRLPELYIAALGTLKHTNVFCPLFAAFGPEPILQRLRAGMPRSW
jgi:acetyl-CoA synthetase